MALKACVLQCAYRIPVLGLSPVPENPAEDLGAWYLRSEAVFAHLRSILEQSHLRRIDRLQSMPEKAMTSLWWPFTQHSLVSKEGVTVIDSRSGENFSVFEVRAWLSCDAWSIKCFCRHCLTCVDLRRFLHPRLSMNG